MTRKEYQIWRNEWDNSDGFGYIYREDEIKKAVNIDHDNYFLTNLDPNEFDLSDLTRRFLNSKESNKEDYDEYNTIENLEGFFEEIGVNATVAACTDDEYLRNEIVYSWSDTEFVDLGDFDELEYVSYLDIGTNHKRHENDGYSVLTTTLTVDADEERCLDEWDGKNKVTGGIGLHEYINKIISLENEEAKDTYLIRRASQWEGERDTAKVMTKEEAIEYLAEIGRNHKDYI